IQYVHAHFCGVGVYISGSDSNGCHVSSVYTYFTGGQYGPTDSHHSNSLEGNGGHSLYPRSAANYFTASYSQNGHRPNCYGVNSYGASLFVQCVTENRLKDLVDFGNTLIGPNITWDPVSTGPILGGQNVIEHNTVASRPVRGGLVQGGPNPAVHWFAADEE